MGVEVTVVGLSAVVMGRTEAARKVGMEICTTPDSQS